MSSYIQERDPLRSKLAEQMAAFEALNGKVQTLPIRIGNAPVETFSIVTPGKPKASHPSRALRSADHKRVTMRTQKKMEKISKVRELAATGIKISDIAEKAGLTTKYVHRLILDHRIVRGPQTAMEG